MNEETRAFSRRFQKRAHNGAMPNDMQAGVYSAVLHFLEGRGQAGWRGRRQGGGRGR